MLPTASTPRAWEDAWEDWLTKSEIGASHSAALARVGRPVASSSHGVSLHEVERVVFSCRLPEDRRRSILGQRGVHTSAHPL